MKFIGRPFIACFVLVASVLCSSCGGPVKLTGKPGSSGKTLELMVVAKAPQYSGSTKRVLDSLFNEPQPGLNQPESRFDMVHIDPDQFNGNTMFQAHRNILQLEVDPQGLNKVYLEYDRWAIPQVVVRITASDVQALDSMLWSLRPRLLKEFYAQEYRRMEKIFSDMPDVKIMNNIKNTYGFSMVVPQEFITAKAEQGFTWLRKETKDFSLSVIVDVSPMKGNDMTEPVILDYLDTLLKHNVNGPADGSYMGTERRDYFYTRDVMLGDIDAVETRGLWRLFNDYMGGCFVCYTFPDKNSDNKVTLLGFVHSPSQRSKMVMKRDLLMQVDGICRSIKYE